MRRDDWSTDPEAQRWLSHVRHQVLPMVEKSNVVVSLCPADGKTDLKFAVELGMSIMLNKPILVVVLPGQIVPPKLAMVADQVVACDVTTPEGRRIFSEAMDGFA